MFGIKTNITAIACCIIGISFYSIANAQEETPILPDLGYQYDKDFCDFEISFPEEPKIKSIDPIVDGEGLESEQLTYVKVFDLDKSLKVSATCKQINKEIRVVISETTLDQELKAIEDDRNIKIVSQDNKLIPEQRVRLASLVAQRNNTPNEGIFIYQIWVSDNSMFTLETEVKGPPYPEIDTLFVAILKSFGKKDKEGAK